MCGLFCEINEINDIKEILTKQQQLIFHGTFVRLDYLRRFHVKADWMKSCDSSREAVKRIVIYMQYLSCRSWLLSAMI